MFKNKNIKIFTGIVWLWGLGAMSVIANNTNRSARKEILPMEEIVERMEAADHSSEISVDRNILFRQETKVLDGKKRHISTWIYPFFGMEGEIVYLMSVDSENPEAAAIPQLYLLGTLKEPEPRPNWTFRKLDPETRYLLVRYLTQKSSLRPEDVLRPQESWKDPESENSFRTVVLPPYFTFPRAPELAREEIPEVWNEEGTMLTSEAFFRKLETLSAEELAELENRWPIGGELEVRHITERQTDMPNKWPAKGVVWQNDGTYTLRNKMWDQPARTIVRVRASDISKDVPIRSTWRDEIRWIRLLREYAESEPNVYREKLRELEDFLFGRPMPQRIAMVFSVLEDPPTWIAKLEDGEKLAKSETSDSRSGRFSILQERLRWIVEHSFLREEGN